MRFLSLFSGIGGFDLGFERAGMECVGQVEIDAACTALLSRYWPNMWRCEDVRKVDGRSPAVDLVCGGFPCQDVSVAGRRAGLAGERSGLWFEFRRILAELRPAWVVIENVPGLLSSNRGRDFAVILHGLGELGYGTAWRILDAQYFGVAQRRRRVFLVGHLGDGRAAEVLFERESLRWDSPPRREAGEGVAWDVAPSLAASGRGVKRAGESRGQDCVIPVAHALRAEAGVTEGGTGRGTPLVCDTVYAGTPGRDAGAAMSMAAPGGVRRLTPTECERLQGFPDEWTAGQFDSARYRQLGNAVCVPIAEWIGRRIVAAQEAQ